MGKLWPAARRSRHPVSSPAFPKQVLQLLVAVGIGLGSYLVATHYVFGTVIVDGDSMNPTLHSTERFLLNRVEFYFREPAAGDIVVIRDPEDGGLSVKRIVAVGGEQVKLNGGAVFVNDRRLHEPYLGSGTRTYGSRSRNFDSIHCGQNEFFVLGDNRTNSADSRIYGPVTRQNILGVVVP